MAFQLACYFSSNPFHAGRLASYPGPGSRLVDRCAAKLQDWKQLQWVPSIRY